MHWDNFTEPISIPKSSITGKIDILFDFIIFNAFKTFDRDLIVKGVEISRFFILVFNFTPLSIHLLRSPSVKTHKSFLFSQIKTVPC